MNKNPVILRSSNSSTALKTGKPWKTLHGLRDTPRVHRASLICRLKLYHGKKKP